MYFGAEPALGTVLTAAGYETFASIVLPHPTWDALHGFDEIDNELAHDPAGSVLGLVTIERALQRLDQRDPARPFFMWVHLFGPHELYMESPALRPWLGTGDRITAYYHDVYAADQALGKLFAGVIARKLTKNTVVAVFSDHGEGLGDNGQQTHQKSGHDAVLRVPFVVRVPGIAPGTSNEVVTTLDLFPTVLQALQIQGLSPRHGQSLLPLMRGQPQPRPMVYFETNAERPTFKGIATADHKLLYDWQRQAYYLYDLRADPGERRNLVSADPELLNEMSARLWSYFDTNYNAALIARKLMRLEASNIRLPQRYKGPAISFVPVAK